MFWECITGLSSESRGQENSSLKGRKAKVDYRLWRTSLESYDRRHLSHHKDVLLVVAGLASRFREAGLSTGRYVAGIWENDISRSLLWYVNTNESNDDPPRRGHRRSKEDPRIPSWTWASTSYPFFFSHPGPANALLGEPRLLFEDEKDDEQSQEGGHTVSYCKLHLSGYVQTVNRSLASVQAVPPYPDSYGEPRKRAGRILRLDVYAKQKPLFAWSFDHDSLENERLFVLRAWNQPQDKVTDYLILQAVSNEAIMSKSRDMIDNDQEKSHVYKRAGEMTVRSNVMPPDRHFYPKPTESTPYPDSDILVDNGEYLSVHGRYESIVLV